MVLKIVMADARRLSIELNERHYWTVVRARMFSFYMIILSLLVSYLMQINRKQRIKFNLNFKCSDVCASVSEYFLIVNK